MSKHRPTRTARRRRTNLSLECLEAKQLLASDLGVNAIEVRSFDGTGNNLENPEWGSTYQQLLRVAQAEYGDGISTPAGEDRPSAREISNALAAQDLDTAASDRQLSAFIYVWGQFLDHDIDLTEPSADAPESFPITIPTGDIYFDPTGTGTAEIPFTRSIFDLATGTDTTNPRQQVNEITAWIDGSNVYGSSEEVANSLREFVGGRMLTSEGDLPPVDENGFFLAGDIRANENIELTSMHTLFLREHNFWADQIASKNPQLSDEMIYQQARGRVIAEIQSITFNEFLPALLGRHAIDDYTGYDATTNPGIANEFSTAAYRLGHSLINDDVEFFGNDGRAVREEVALSEAFFNPSLLQETGIDSILKYSASSVSQELDLQLVDSLRNFLFGPPGAGGLDLASLNIQRGRDHGLADYNDVREAYGLDPVDSFDDISSDVSVQIALEELYGNVDNIDLWVGALAEDHEAGSSVGETIQAIASDQFERIRDGDRLWYQNVYAGRELREIEQTSLADVIQRNTSITNLQKNVFFMRTEVTGQVFVDGNANGHQDRQENGLEGITLELLNDEGDVIATTQTDIRGRYVFTEFEETGDYQIRILLPTGATTSGPTTVDVLVSSGDDSLGNLDFALSGDPLNNGGGGHDGGAGHHQHRPSPRDPGPGGRNVRGR